MSILTVKQAKFVANYLAGQKQTEAYANAGYAGDKLTLYASASKLFRSPTIQVAIQERREAAEVSEGIDLPQIIAGLHDNAVLAREDKQYSASNQAWGLIGKALGLITDKHEVTTTSIRLDMTRALEGKSVEELLRLAAKAPRAVSGPVIDAEEQGQP